jgi:hypothetical protein
MQQQAQQSMANLQPAQQLGVATQMAGLAGLRAGNMNYQGGDFANQYQRPAGYQSSLQQFQMERPENVSTGRFIDPDVMQQYMSPYQQAVTDIDKREAMRSSNVMQQQSQAQAAQQGAFGGSRTAMVEAERQRNLGQQMGDIQTRGSQAAFQQGAQNFQMDQQRAMQAALANQQMGFGTGQQNLAAQLGVQQLGEQSRQFGYGQDMNAAQLAAQYGTEAQRMTEQSRQFGANFGLQGLQQQLAAASTLGQLGQTQFGQQKDIIQGQSAMGQQQQALEQQRLQQQYQDFLNQRAYPQQQLAYFSDMLRGLPLSQTTQQMYQAPPSALSQYGGLALAGYGMSRKAGGPIKESKAPAGLSELLLYDMENA